MAQLHFTLDSEIFTGLFSKTKDETSEIVNVKIKMYKKWNLKMYNSD